MPERRTPCKRTSKLDPYKETIGKLTLPEIFLTLSPNPSRSASLWDS